MTEQFAKTQYNMSAVPALTFQALLRVGSPVTKRTTAGGRSVSSISGVASQRFLKAGTTGSNKDDWGENKCWYKAELWGEAADRLAAKGIDKGDVVLVTMSSAKLKAHGWQGQTEIMAGIEATCDSIKLVAKKVGGEDVPVNEPEFVGEDAPEEELPF